MLGRRRPNWLNGNLGRPRAAEESQTVLGFNNENVSPSLCRRPFPFGPRTIGNLRMPIARPHSESRLVVVAIDPSRNRRVRVVTRETSKHSARLVENPHLSSRLPRYVLFIDPHYPLPTLEG